ncbi:hypothetical protein B7P43_G05444 [Cryptotermes secundus]|uniref:Uncharacterized protein n=2 Tax=Cryptotermes secundus TaxID=105785 RepID=A0A2J7QI86_9NEOP|nr:hypothetical protein B7P43_G05444 [Cryptotermes secundus]
MSSPSRTKFSNDGDNDKTPSPPSSKSLLSSPSSLLRAFASPLRSLELNQSHKSHHKPPSGGRAQYLVGLAVAVNDMESPQALSLVPPRKPEESRSIIVASPPSLPLSRKKLVYGMSDGDGASDASSLERPQSSTAGCETASSACISNLANVPCKRALKQPFGEEGTLPSKKTRVWFPDPEVSDTLLFYANDTVESGVGRMTGRELPCSETNMLPNTRRRRRCRTLFSSDADVHDESHVSVRSSNLTGIYGCAKEISTQSQSSPDLSGLASQGSVEEITTELLNSQDAFFPPLINCTHPIECVASRLTTHVMWTKALVVELTRKNICTIGDLSRLDEASINRLPIANPKISHAKAVLQDYMKSLEVESERSTNMKAGGTSRSDSVQLEPESVSSLEARQISAEDVVKFFLSNRGSLAAVLGEASKAGQCGVRLHQEMLSVFRGAGSSSEVTEESVDTEARSGRGTVSEHSFDELPQTEVMKYLVKHNPDGLCKVVSENSALASKVSQSYLQSQLASGHLSHKDFFDRLFSTGCKNTLLSAMQSYLMLKTSPEEIVEKLPAESVMQYVTSKLNLIDKVVLCIEGMMSDATTEIPADHYQKLVEAVANKVTQMEFTTIYYNITMANLRSK